MYKHKGGLSFPGSTRMPSIQEMICPIYPEDERKKLANIWYNRYQEYNDDLILKRETTLDIYNQDNYYYLENFVLPDEDLPIPTAESLSQKTGKVEAVSYRKTKLLVDYFYKNNFNNQELYDSSKTGSLENTANKFVDTNGNIIKENIPKFPKYKTKNIFFNEEPTRASIYFINILYKVWIIIQLVYKLSDKNFENINLKIDDQGKKILIKKFKEKLIKEACKKLNYKLLNQINNNFLSTTNQHFTRDRALYNAFAVTHRTMSDEEAYKKFFIKNALSKNINISLPAILYLKNEHKKWKKANFDKYKKKNRNSTYVDWRQMPDHEIKFPSKNPTAFAYRLYIKAAEINLFKHFYKRSQENNEEGVSEWDSYRNLLRKQELPRPEWDPYDIHWLYSSQLSYFYSSGYYHHKDFYYGCSTKWYSSFSKLSHEKTINIHKIKALNEWDGNLNEKNDLDISHWNFSNSDLKTFMVNDFTRVYDKYLSNIILQEKENLLGLEINTYGGNYLQNKLKCNKNKKTKKNIKGGNDWDDIVREIKRLINERYRKSQNYYHNYFSKNFTTPTYYIPVKFCPEEQNGDGTFNLSDTDINNFTDNSASVSNNPINFKRYLVMSDNHQLARSKWYPLPIHLINNNDSLSTKNKKAAYNIQIKGSTNNKNDMSRFLEICTEVYAPPEELTNRNASFTVPTNKMTSTEYINRYRSWGPMFENRSMDSLRFKGKNTNDYHNTFDELDISGNRKIWPYIKDDSDEKLNSNITSQYQKELINKASQVKYYINKTNNIQDLLPRNINIENLSILEKIIADRSTYKFINDQSHNYNLKQYQHIDVTLPLLILERIMYNITKLYKKYFGEPKIDKLLVELSHIEGKINFIDFLIRNNIPLSSELFENKKLAIQIIVFSLDHINIKIKNINIFNYEPIKKIYNLNKINDKNTEIDIDSILMIAKKHINQNIKDISKLR